MNFPSATNERITLKYDDLDMSPQEIADDEQLDVECVKVCLNIHSQKYRNATAIKQPNEQEEEITDTEYKLILQGYKSLALTSENEHIREKASKYLIEEKKGRNEARIKALMPTANNGGVVNVLMLQQAFGQIKKIRRQLRGEQNDTLDIQEVNAA
jgi:hypothetical protein